MRLLQYLLYLLAIFVINPPVAEASDNFNVIVILADDLGYECIGANGSKSYQTPYLDRIAREGVRFEQCYAQPNCTPTRVQMMTGMSNVRNYVDFGTLAKTEITFGNLFRDAGYSTCIAGKWQLGSNDALLPQHFGFDQYCLWSMLGRGERYADPSLAVNGELKTFEGKYGPDVCQDFVVDFIRSNRSKPFLVYYPMILTHGHYEATPDSPDYRKSSAKAKKSNQQHFADMVAYMDKQIGGLVSELESLGLRKSTLILFTGDNGTGRGATSALADGSEHDGEKGSTTRGGMHVPLIASWPGTIKPGTVCSDLIDMTDFLPTICEATGVAVPKKLNLDGRSFLPQLRGEKGTPREWIFSYWVPLRASQTKNVGDRGAVEQAFDHRFKLYSTGAFFDLDQDVGETSPKIVTELQGEAAVAAQKFERALAQFKDARPANMNPPRVPGDKKRKNK